MVFEHFKPLYYNIKQEQLYAIYLNAKGKIISKKLITIGNINSSLIDEVSVDSNVVTGDDMRLKMKYNNGELSLYYSTSLSGNMTLLKTFTYNEISPYFTHDSNKKTYFGNVVEVYMGSTSVGYDNIVYFNNTITKN